MGTMRPKLSFDQDVPLARLLHWLDHNTERAVEQYERLRWGLTEFFAQRGCRAAEELADKTLDRVAHIIRRNNELTNVTPGAYCYGVARNILNEYWRNPEHRAIPLDELAPTEHPTVTQQNEPPPWQEPRQLACLEKCLQSLAPSDRHLIERYYQSDDRARIQARSALAAEVEISLATLYARVHRLKRRLATCLQQCCRET